MAIPSDTLKLSRQLEAAFRGELKVAVRDLKIWTGSIATAAVALLFTALHIWPPH